MRRFQNVTSTGMEKVTADVVAGWAMGMIGEWLPGYLHEEDASYSIRQLDDGVFQVNPADERYGDGPRFAITVTVEELT